MSKLKRLRRLRVLIRYGPNLGIFLLLILLLIGFVIKKDPLHYVNRKYHYAVQFPQGWVKGYENKQAVSYHSEEIMPIAQEPHAATVFVVNDRMDGKDLTGHFDVIVADLLGQGVQILNEGTAAVDLEEARWVEFRDANGLNNHIWYIFFIDEERFMIIQNRISVLHVDKYNDDIGYIIDNFYFRR
ncbi:MAG TPA: hypothetical protein VI749_09535 [Candidatus Omnitrophota bacterium]|nr:hypothetical protein [Candidatus Omnitrophota bacterium]